MCKQIFPLPVLKHCQFKTGVCFHLQKRIVLGKVVVIMSWCLPPPPSERPNSVCAGTSRAALCSLRPHCVVPPQEKPVRPQRCGDVTVNYMVTCLKLGWAGALDLDRSSAALACNADGIHVRTESFLAHFWPLPFSKSLVFSNFIFSNWGRLRLSIS